MTDAPDRFFAAPRRLVATSAGPVELPIAYHEATHLYALFAVDSARAAALLAAAGLVPARLAGGRALAALSFYDYRDTGIGPYLEVGSALAVVPPAQRPPASTLLDLLRDAQARRVGFHVLDLPVTTEAANAAGRELWGYPKFVTALSVQLGTGRFEGRVADPAGGGMILRLAGPWRGWLPVPALSPVTLSRRGGALLRTVVRVRGPYRAGRGALVLELAGRHPMAERLRQLGLDGARALAAVATTRFKAMLPAGVELDAPAP